MTEWSVVDDEISIFDFGSTLLRNRFWILGAAVVGALLAVIPKAFAPLQYTSVATVVSASAGQGSDSRVMGLASQLGLGGLVGSGGSLLTSPAFLMDIASSPVILGKVLADSVSVEESGGERHLLLDLLVGEPSRGALQSQDIERRRLAGIEALRGSMVLARNKETGVVELALTTRWPSVSESANRLVLDEVNRFYLEMGQSRASEERRFVERRVAEKDQQLKTAENRVAVFLEANRQFQNSPALAFERDRLLREVALHQQVLVGLAQALEDVRIREVRDTPLLTVVQPPQHPVRPNPRKRLQTGIVGLLAGGLFGVLISFVQMSMLRRDKEDPEMRQFLMLLRESIASLDPRTYFGSRKNET